MMKCLFLRNMEPLNGVGNTLPRINGVVLIRSTLTVSSIFFSHFTLVVVVKAEYIYVQILIFLSLI